MNHAGGEGGGESLGLGLAERVNMSPDEVGIWGPMLWPRGTFSPTLEYNYMRSAAHAFSCLEFHSWET